MHSPLAFDNVPMKQVRDNDPVGMYPCMQTGAHEVPFASKEGQVEE
jgi:hypothetical protein